MEQIPVKQNRGEYSCTSVPLQRHIYSTLSPCHRLVVQISKHLSPLILFSLLQLFLYINHRNGNEACKELSQKKTS